MRTGGINTREIERLKREGGRIQDNSTKGEGETEEKEMEEN